MRYPLLFYSQPASQFLDLKMWAANPSEGVLYLEMGAFLLVHPPDHS